MSPRRRNYEHCETKELRETSKAIIVVYDPEFGPCILLGKENVNDKYGLFGGGINKEEAPKGALYRELHEELFDYKAKPQITQRKRISDFKTNSKKVHLYVVSLGNRYIQLSKEHSGIQLYPLDKRYANERKAIESNMEHNAKNAVSIFQNRYPKPADRNKFQSGIRPREDKTLSEQMKQERMKFLKDLGLEETRKGLFETLKNELSR